MALSFFSAGLAGVFSAADFFAVVPLAGAFFAGARLEAACLIASKMPNVEQQYDAQTLELAHRTFPREFGLMELFLEAAWANGYSSRRYKDRREVMRFAFGEPSSVPAGYV